MLVIKFGVLANSVDHLLAGQQLRDKFYFDIGLVTVGMMVARTLPRNKKITSVTSPIAINRVW